LRLPKTFSTGLDAARDLIARGKGARELLARATHARRGQATKQDEIAEEEWRQEQGQDDEQPDQQELEEPRPDPYEQYAMEIAEGSQNDSEGVLAIHNLAKAYKARRVVEDVSLHVRRGEAVGLLGPNGAGKTTVFYMITGLVKPDRGTITLDGYDVTPLPMYRRARLGIGYLPQEMSVFRGLTVEQNIRAVLEIVEPNKERREEQLEGLLEEFRLAHLRNTPAIAVSGGERRRCEIARAIAGKPSFMLLDEPFAGIDPIAIGGIQDLVRHLKKRGIGVLITDHSVRETLGLTDRAYIIYNGHVLTEGAPAEIVANPDVRRIYLGEDFKM